MHRHVDKPARHHGQQKSQTRVRERRHQLAHEAARWMAESGTRNYQQAKLKAAERLGFSDDASLPRNGEIEAALREYQRLFQRDNGAQLRRRREAALRAMDFFQDYEPRLVGPVLDGTADARSPVTLHFYTDDPDAAPRFLSQTGIPAELGSHALKLDRERSAQFPVCRFSAEDVPFEITVLPLDVLRQAPLSAIDGKPMKRASAVQLRQMLAAEEIAGYQAVVDT